jgi:hypothetical protein
MIEAYIFHDKFKINRQKTIELSCLINFCSYGINWLYFLLIQWLISYRSDLQLQMMTYAILGKTSDPAFNAQIISFFFASILFNFVIIVTLEFFGFNFASQLILMKNQEYEESYKFFMTIIKENNAQKLLTITWANLCSYIATIIIFFLMQLKTSI